MTTAIEMTASEIVLLDSSGWLEYITGDEKADAIIYATARAHQAELVTSDVHFTGLPGVTILL
jgi:hypothetical protein